MTHQNTLPIRLLATFCLIGYLRPAPGTWGSLAGAIVFVLVLHTPLFQPVWLFMALMSGLIIGLGVWTADTYGRATGRTDAPEVVIDEVAGQWLALMPLLFLSSPLPGWAETLLAFGLFRLFDILKPGPIGWLDKNIKGGLGVMLDDMAAGLAAAMCLAVLMSVL